MHLLSPMSRMWKCLFREKKAPKRVENHFTAEETTIPTEVHTIQTRWRHDGTRHTHVVTFKLIFSPRSLQAGHTKVMRWIHSVKLWIRFVRTWSRSRKNTNKRHLLLQRSVIWNCEIYITIFQLVNVMFRRSRYCIKSVTVWHTFDKRWIKCRFCKYIHCIFLLC